MAQYSPYITWYYNPLCTAENRVLVTALKSYGPIEYLPLPGNVPWVLLPLAWWSGEPPVTSPATDRCLPNDFLIFLEETSLYQKKHLHWRENKHRLGWLVVYCSRSPRQVSHPTEVWCYFMCSFEPEAFMKTTCGATNHLPLVVWTPKKEI